MKRASYRPAANQRRLWFPFVTIFLFLLLAEAISFFALSVAFDAWATPSVMRNIRGGLGYPSAVANGEGPAASGAYTQYAVHPYLGYVLDEDFDSASRLETGGEDALDYGFQLTEAGIFHPADERTLVIALTGGSVAFGLTLHFADEMESRILTGLAGEVTRVVVVNLALPGFKQPQQVLLLNYLLTLGAHFDVVVNLDGFNEIALAPAENLPKQVAPVFPHAWYYRVAEFDPQTQLTVGELMLEQRRRRELAQAFDNPLVTWSSSLGLVWTILDRRQTQRIGEIETRISELQSSDLPSFSVSGPDRGYSSTRGMLVDLAGVWDRGSRLMDGLCRRSGIRYLHFLQPNQYLTGSKGMSEAERLAAVNPELPSSDYVELGYPLLRSLGRSLQEDGVHFVDLTMIFSSTSLPTYSDDCCHYTELGEQIVASAIADEIVSELVREN